MPGRASVVNSDALLPADFIFFEDEANQLEL